MIFSGLNGFVYCNNNPLNYIDPWGYAKNTLTDNIVSLIRIIVYLGAIYSLAQNDSQINAIPDFINRMYTISPNLNVFANNMEKGYRTLIKDTWWSIFKSALEKTGTVLDIKEIAGKPSALSDPISLIGAAAEFLNLFYNPFVPTEECDIGTMRLIFDSIANTGIVGLSVTAGTIMMGYQFALGIATGFVTYALLRAILYELDNILFYYGG